MNSHYKEIIGSLLSVIGTIQAAIGNTPQFQLNENETYLLRLTGNTLQALGSALSADGQGTVSFEKIGDEIQATGNSTVITGMLLNGIFEDEETEQRLNIAGSWIQALGSFVGLTDEFFDSTEDGRLENITGNLLQGVGNSLQAIGGIQALHDKGSEQYQIGVAGSWIQAAGSVISLIGQIQEESEEIRRNINE
ncbi:DUF6944 family repetitive protein [Bacillus niameyensis]|uniref:DUF6944 family repetitive protein n=1 Tax=Bacillus niameyensis TaxID=1522308 RepID=UPI000783C826|nr:hypothetical protein [Bacillus niameyensis]